MNMFKLIKEKLQQIGCDTFELTESLTTAWEFYFIRHRLDQNRSTRVRTYTCKLYRPLEGGMLGAATGIIDPTANEQEVERILKNTYYQASLVKNPAYTLTDVPVPEQAQNEVDFESISESFLTAMRNVPETETERINSYEIFVREIRKTFENSNGVRYCAVYPSSMIEVVVNASRDGHEIELYRSFTSGVCDAEKLTRDVTEALRFGKDRLVALPTPKLGRADVVFSTSDAVELYRYFSYRMNASLQFRKLSDWKKGEPVAEYQGGDRISLYAATDLDNSSRSFRVDEQGALIRERYLIRDGVAETTWGDRQMSEYLGEKDSSIVYNFVVSGGTASEEELHKGNYLELCEFSDFQVDPVGGDILGEIRLGYWHHDGRTEIITGGSVSGTMQEAVPSMRFSEATEQYDTFVIPKETRLYGLSITGIV